MRTMLTLKPDKCGDYDNLLHIHIKVQSPPLWCVYCCTVRQRFYHCPCKMTCMIIRKFKSFTLTRDFVCPWSRKKNIIGCLIKIYDKNDLVKISQIVYNINLNTFQIAKTASSANPFYLQFEKRAFFEYSFHVAGYYVYTLVQIMYISLWNLSLEDYK